MDDRHVDDRVDVTDLDGIVTSLTTIAPNDCVNMHAVRKRALKPACQHTTVSSHNITS